MRKFDAQSMVVLPALDARRAVALVEAVLTRVREEEVNVEIGAAVRELEGALAGLREAMRARIGEAVSEEDRRAAHRVAAAAWRGARRFVQSWAGRSEEDAKSRLARQVEAGLFQDGLPFLKSNYPSAWAEADERLRWLEDAELDGAFGRLGGAEFLRELRVAHKAYGEVLGMSIREPLDGLVGKVREYVLLVAADGQASADEGKTLRLLAPLIELESLRAPVELEAQLEESLPAGV